MTIEFTEISAEWFESASPAVEGTYAISLHTDPNIGQFWNIATYYENRWNELELEFYGEAATLEEAKAQVSQAIEDDLWGY